MRWLTSQPANQQVFAYTSPLICYRQSSHVIALQSSTVTILYATEKQPKYRANIIFVLLLFFFIENKNSQCFDVSEVKKCLAYILFVYKFELISPQGEVEKHNRNGQAPQSDEQYKEQEFPIQQNTNWLSVIWQSKLLWPKQ